MKQKIIIAITAFISVASQIVLPFAVNEAYIERGYFAIGGEWVFTVIGIGAMIFAGQAIVDIYAEKLVMEKLKTKKFERAYIKVALNNYANEEKVS